MNLPRRIRELRYAKGWSAVELASRAKISRSALGQLESGATTNPHAETLKRVSRALGLPIEVLLASPPVRDSLPAGLPAPAVAPPEVSSESPVRLSPARVEELVGMFTILLSSPLADAIARIVEESSRLVPIIPSDSAEGRPLGAPRVDIAPPRRRRGRGVSPD
jgi:transcriptional regulator with XRE-family HTH domain